MDVRVCPTCRQQFATSLVFCPQDGTKLQEPTTLEPAKDPLIGTTVGGRYKILKKIGEGGMGVVYQAEHVTIEKPVAVKVLKDTYAQREDVVARFQLEAKSASRVKHEGVLEVFDFGHTQNGEFFLVMELLEGEDLAKILVRDQKLAPVRAVRILTLAARALAAAHAKGIIHRDMKPENIFVRTGDDGREYVKIVDFGIAQLRAEGEAASDPNAKVDGRKLTKTGVVFGTPEYMSPEQSQGKPIDFRVDIYALGIILMELLAGRTPFQGETFMAILSAHFTQPVPRLEDLGGPDVKCSRELEAVIFKALAKQPDDRFRSMNDLVMALLMTPEGQLAELSTAVSIASPMMRSTPFGTKPPQIRAVAETAIDPTQVATVTPTDDVTVAKTGELRESYQPSRGSRGLLYALMIVLLIAASVGGIALWKSMKDAGKTTITATSESALPTTIISGAPSVSIAQSTSVAPVVSASAPQSETVSVHVIAVPSNAVVERQVQKTWAQVCDRTPCAVTVPRGQLAVFRASLAGASSPERSVQPDADQDITLTVARAVGAVRSSASGSSHRQQVCFEDNDPTGLKVITDCNK